MGILLQITVATESIHTAMEVSIPFKDESSVEPSLSRQSYHFTSVASSGVTSDTVTLRISVRNSHGIKPKLSSH